MSVQIVLSSRQNKFSKAELTRNYACDFIILLQVWLPKCEKVAWNTLFKYILAGPKICQFVGYKKGHILACHKEMSFVSSKHAFSDSKNAFTSSIKRFEKTQ